MRHNPAQLSQLEATTPPSAAVQERARQYMDVAQISLAELARRIAYSNSAMRQFMSGTYITSGIAATDVQIRRALVDFIDAHPVRIATETEGVLYETSNTRVLRHWFNFCLEHREMAGVYGAPGSQKTFVARHLVAEHNAREIHKNGHGTRAYWVYCSEQIAPRELLRRMCQAAAIPGAQHIQSLLANIKFHLGKRKALFLFDEAQHLSIGCLEIIRELNDCPPHCGVLLQGSHGLFDTFSRRAAELEQWNSRLANFVALPGMEMPEVVGIIEAELGTQTPEQLKHLLENSLVVDPHSKKRGQRYYSARRLFKQLNLIKANPRFVAPNPAVASQKVSAA